MEIWKDIEGYEGYYKVSDKGNILSINYSLRGYSALLTPKINCKGYAWVELYKNGSHKPILIHRLVAKAFVSNPQNHPIVNHKDENTLNNCADNLEWCTHKYNVVYSLELHPERRKKSGGQSRTRVRSAYISSRRVRQIDILSGEVVKEYRYLGEVKNALGKSITGIRECCLGKRNKAYGYKWEFCE